MNDLNIEKAKEPQAPEKPKTGATGRDIKQMSELVPDPEDQKLVPIARITEALKRLLHLDQNDQ